MSWRVANECAERRFGSAARKRAEAVKEGVDPTTFCGLCMASH